MSTTFAVSDVQPGKYAASNDWSNRCYAGSRAPAKNTAKQNLEAILNAKVEACAEVPEQIESFPTHGLFETLRIAFANHYPVVLSPDDIWLTIAQGVAAHVGQNAEKLRSKFVKHQGTKQLLVRRDEFVVGSAKNDWVGVFGEFSEKIKDEVGADNQRMLVADFSTTNPTTKAASEVVLMDAMQQYFEYVVQTRCGIPQITLDGTVEDWEKIRDKINMFAGLDLDWWTPSVKQVIEKFIEAAKGGQDKNWWRSCYKYNTVSGGDNVSGWMTWLLPYVSDGGWRGVKTVRNHRVGKLSNDSHNGLSTRVLPLGVSRVPFIWDYYGDKLPYEFAAGFSGVQQNAETLTVKPVITWAVLPKQERKAPSPSDSDY